MIKASELRIGNWVLAGGEPFEVNPDVIAVIYNEGGRVEYNPIILTHELVIKAGFWRYGAGSFAKNKIWIVYASGTYFFEVGDITIGRGIMYLHQLQNLYYALTGEELEINLQ